MRNRTAIGFGAWALLVAGALAAQTYNVTFLHTPSANAIAGRDLVVSGNIIGADQVSIAALAYRVGADGEYEIRELRLVSGDFYEGTIPGAALKPPFVEYYCYAIDFEGNRLIVFASEKVPQKVNVVSPDSVAATGKKPPKKPHKKPKSIPDKTAQPDAGLEESLALFGAEDLVKVATRSEQTVERAPSIVSVVTREQIEGMGAVCLADILDQLPGISVSRTVSGEYRAAVRGVLSDPQVLVLLDGHRINDLYSGNALLEFPAEAVERVEVIRGPGSALYGTGAFMAVVDIRTRQGIEPRGSAAYGLYNRARGSAGAGWEGDGWRVGGQVQFVFGQGQERQVEKDLLSGVEGSVPLDTAGDVSNAPGSVDDSQLLVHGQLQAAATRLAGGELNFLSHYLFQVRGGFVGKYDSLDTGSAIGLHLFSADLTYRVPLSDLISLDSRVYFDTQLAERAFQVIPNDDNDFHNAYLAGGTPLADGMQETTRYQSITTGVEVSSRFKLFGTNQLVVGLLFEYLGLPSFNLVRDLGEVTCAPCAASEAGCIQIQGFQLPCGELAGAPAGKERMVVGFLVQDQWTDLLPGLDLLAGIRLDYFTDFGITFNPRAAIVYSPLPQIGIKALYSKAFRAPTFQELYEDPRFDPLRSFQGSAQLDPVTIHTLEFGVESHLENRPLDVRLRANFFYNWIFDSIEALDAGSGLPTYDNFESLQVYGTEVEGQARFGERNRFFANSSWFRATVKAAGSSSESYITDVPQMRFNLGLDMGVLSWLNVHLGVVYGSERRSNVRRPMEVLRSFSLPAYTLVRAGLSTEPLLFEHLVLFAHAFNVFDFDLRDPPPRPDTMPGYLPRAPFQFMAGIAWRP